MAIFNDITCVLDVPLYLMYTLFPVDLSFSGKVVPQYFPVPSRGESANLPFLI